MSYLSWSQGRKALLGIASLLLIASSLTGCRMEHAESTGADDAYLRAFGEKQAPAQLSGSIYPLTRGSRWRYSTRTASRTDSSQQPVLGKEEVEVLGPRAVGKSSGVALQIYQNGKPFRQEVLRLDERELTLVAAGINGEKGASDTMQITPGIPLLRLPLNEGEIVAWEGILKLTKNNIAAPGNSYSRVTGYEEVKVPAGAFKAYKVETVIDTTVQRRQIQLYSARWLAPGVGMVRQVIMVAPGSQIITKELQKYTRGGGGK